MSVWFRIKETSLKYNIFMGIPVKCETKSKRNESKRNSSNRNEIYRKETKYTSFCFGKFRFVSIYFVSFRFVSFRFRFAFYRYPLKKIGGCFWFSVFVNFPSTNIFVDFFFCRESWWRHCPWIIFSQSKNRITNQLHVFDPTKLQRELPFNLKKGEGGACHFFYKIFRFWSLEKKSN